MELKADTKLNPNAPKICLLDIDGVVVSFGDHPLTPKEGVAEKVNALVKDGWKIVAFTTRDWASVYPLIARGIPIHGYIFKPLASEIMIVDDILSDARNQL